MKDITTDQTNAVPAGPGWPIGGMGGFTERPDAGGTA
jgi:hypothetical protein